MSEEKLVRQFEVTGPVRLNVQNIRGIIEIRPGAENLIQVTAVKHTQTGSEKLTEIEISVDKDGVIQVITRFPNKGLDWIFNQRPCSVDYIITTPHTCTVNTKAISSTTLVDGIEGDIVIQSVSGNVQANNLTGSLWVKTVSGDIQLKTINGTITGNSVSGDVNGQQLNGQLTLDLVSGKVKLSESNLSSIQANSSSGDILIATSLRAGPYNSHSISGNITLIIPVNTRCSGELQSISGHISANLPQSTNSPQRGSQRVEILGGGVKVSLSSISGTLSLTC